MAQTLVSDVIVPEIFLPYVTEQTPELTAFKDSGILDTDPQFSTLASATGGQFMNMPFWNDINDPDQVVDDVNPLTTSKIIASQDVAVFHQRANGWSTNDLAGLLAGSDPMKEIANLVARYWARRTNHLIFSFLAGIFASTNTNSQGFSPAVNLTNKIYLTSGPTPTSANQLNGSTFIDTKQLLGDNKDKLTAIGIHSATEASLAKQDLIDFLPDSEGKPTIKTFQGLRVIIDDSSPVQTINSLPVYTSYFFGEGAIAFGEDTTTRLVEGAAPGSTWNLEFARTANAGTSFMYMRRRFICHVRGIKFNNASMAGKSPTNTELANGTNWSLVYELKNIRVVAVMHNIA